MDKNVNVAETASSSEAGEKRKERIPGLSSSSLESENENDDAMSLGSSDDDDDPDETPIGNYYFDISELNEVKASLGQNALDETIQEMEYLEKISANTKSTPEVPEMKHPPEPKLKLPRRKAYQFLDDDSSDDATDKEDRPEGSDSKWKAKPFSATDEKPTNTTPDNTRKTRERVKLNDAFETSEAQNVLRKQQLADLKFVKERKALIPVFLSYLRNLKENLEKNPQEFYCSVKVPPGKAKKSTRPRTKMNFFRKPTDKQKEDSSSETMVNYSNDKDKTSSQNKKPSRPSPIKPPAPTGDISQASETPGMSNQYFSSMSTTSPSKKTDVFRSREEERLFFETLLDDDEQDARARSQHIQSDTHSDSSLLNSFLDYDQARIQAESDKLIRDWNYEEFNIDFPGDPYPGSSTLDNSARASTSSSGDPNKLLLEEVQKLKVQMDGDAKNEAKEIGVGSLDFDDLVKLMEAGDFGESVSPRKKYSNVKQEKR